MRTLIAIAALAACTPTAPPPPKPPAPAALSSGDTRYAALVALLARNPATGKPVDSVAELVPLLDRDLRANFTLVYATRSAQKSVDPAHPRAVLFGTDARLVLAFTGQPGGADLDVLEVLRYRDDARAFELAQWVLPAAVRRDPTLAIAAHDNGAPNPPECLRCHGTDPRPIFDTYPVWPGFYGSAQDAFDHAPPDELAGYQTFLANRTGVYAGLELPPGSPVSPYALVTAEDTSGKLAPNMRFGMALTERNRERIARMLAASPRFAALRDELVAGLLGCVAMPIDSAARAHVLAELVAENAAKLDRARISDPEVRHKLRMLELASVANLTELDYVARALGVSRADWSMAIEPGALGLFDGILSSRVVIGDRARDFYIKEDFLYELMRGADSWKPIPYAIHGRTGQRLDLKAAIAGCDAFAARARGGWPATQPSPPPVVYRCVRCHEPGGVGPAIPFDLPEKLRAADLGAAVRARTAPEVEDDSRMPLGEPALTPEERESLLAYLGQLQL